MKDFDNWNIEKKRLETRERGLIDFREREIWWCSIGINLGSEQDGKNRFFERPVLILKKFNNRMAWILPMSSKRKDGPYFYMLINQGKSDTILLSQLRLVSFKRMLRIMGKVSKKDLIEIKKKLIKLLN